MKLERLSDVQDWNIAKNDGINNIEVENEKVYAQSKVTTRNSIIAKPKHNPAIAMNAWRNGNMIVLITNLLAWRT